MPLSEMVTKRLPNQFVGRLLGSWLGLAVVPVWPIVTWIFQPYFSVEKLMAQGLSVATALRFQAELHHLGSAVLLGRIFPELLICLMLCLFCSMVFGRLGGALEFRLRQSLKTADGTKIVISP